MAVGAAGLAVHAEQGGSELGKISGGAAEYRGSTRIRPLLPPGVLRVLRSHACRSAFMFGDALEREECEELLRCAPFGGTPCRSQQSAVSSRACPRAGAMRVYKWELGCMCMLTCTICLCLQPSEAQGLHA